MLEHVEFYEGDFTNYFNHSSKYRGPPSKELEENWLYLWDRKFEHPLSSPLNYAF